MATPAVRGNSLYTIVDGPSWTKAEANSVKLGGHLVTINDSRENTWIHDNFKLNPWWDRSSDIELFGGLFRTSIASSWQWSSGEPVTFTQWSNGEPSAGPGELYLGLGWSDPYSWNDTNLEPVTPQRRLPGAWPYPLDMYRGLAEIPLTSSITFSTTPKEGAGEFTTSINLSAGAQSTGNFAEGAIVYWKVKGITTDDLASGSLSGSGTITNGKLDLKHSLKDDPDSGERLEVSVFSDSSYTQQIGSTNSIAIQEAVPSYSLSTSVTAIGEGESFSTTVSTTNVAAGTPLFYALNGTGITSADFSAGSLLGSGVVSSSGSFSFSHTLANDLTTEGTETLDIKLFSDSNRSTQVGSTASVSIRDTSTTPVPTYSLSTSTNALGEGESFSTTVSTTNVAAGTSLFYALSGTGITAADFTAGGLSGSGTIGSDSKFSFSRTFANDLTTEGTETLNIKLFSDAALATQVGNTPSVTIYDTSTTPQAAININGTNNGIANAGTINNSGTINTGTINTNSGNTTNITNNNIDKSKTVTIAPTTINNITNNTTNNISINAVITNTSAPTYNVSNTYAKNLIGDVLTGSPQLTQNSYDAKFYNLGGGRYGVQQKGKSTIDEITGATSLQFQDQAISLASDVAATFNQVKGIDDVSGVVFRLYNAAFARLPDANGLENWINGNKSGGQTYASSALEFSKSQEFKNRYGSSVSDTQYVNTLYNNVLGRAPDAAGLAHYQGLLASGKDRGSLLLDFSESPENRTLFTKVTGLS